MLNRNENNKMTSKRKVRLRIKRILNNVIASDAEILRNRKTRTNLAYTLFIK